MRGFPLICAAIAARRCRNGEQSVKTIAKSAGKNSATIRRWLQLTRGTTWD